MVVMPRLTSAACVLLVAFSGTSLAQDALGRQAVRPLGARVPPEMTHEETLVRTAYSKFTYASDQEVIGHLALESLDRNYPVPKGSSGLSIGQRLAAAHVSFKLSDFAVGNLADVINRKAVDLISPPIGEILAAATPVYFVDDKSWCSLQPMWQPAPQTTAEELTATLEELHGMKWQSEAPTTVWQRYASYSVTVTYQGKSRGPYKALFIFGHDAKGNEMVMPEDTTTDPIALATVLAMHLFPEPFVRTQLRTYPVVADWLSSNQNYGAACSVGEDDVCCDLMQLRCGIPAKVLEKSLAVPIDPESRKFLPKVAPPPASNCAHYNAQFPSTQTAFVTSDHSGTPAANNHIVTRSFTRENSKFIAEVR
jgi:hypothetical protein